MLVWIKQLRILIKIKTKLLEMIKNAWTKNVGSVYLKIKQYLSEIIIFNHIFLFFSN